MTDKLAKRLASEIDNKTDIDELCKKLKIIKNINIQKQSYKNYINDLMKNIGKVNSMEQVKNYFLNANQETKEFFGMFDLYLMLSIFKEDNDDNDYEKEIFDKYYQINIGIKINIIQFIILACVFTGNTNYLVSKIKDTALSINTLREIYVFLSKLIINEKNDAIKLIDAFIEHIQIIDIYYMMDIFIENYYICCNQDAFNPSYSKLVYTDILPYIIKKIKIKKSMIKYDIENTYNLYIIRILEYSFINNDTSLIEQMDMKSDYGSDIGDIIVKQQYKLNLMKIYLDNDTLLSILPKDIFEIIMDKI